jgi:IMP dehydrogenase
MSFGVSALPRRAMTTIEIGLGKSARRGFRLAELSIVPSRRTRDADDVDTSWRIDAFALPSPLLVRGEVGSEQAVGVVGAEAYLDGDGLDETALKAALALAGQEGLRALEVRPQRAKTIVELLPTLELDLLIIHGKIVSAEHVSREREPLNLKRLVRQLEIPVIVGACSSYQGALHLMRTGAAGVIVGGLEPVVGVGAPLATAIADVRSARMTHLDETGVYCQVIASGALETGADVAKSVVCGADAALLDADRGGALSTQEIISGLRATMATCGYENLKEFQSADLVVAT